MIVRFKRLVGALLLAIVLPTISHAEAPIGHFDTPPPAQSPVIWDLTGSYQASDGFVTTTFDIAQDDQGKLTGTGTESGVIEGVDVNINYSILGSIASRPNRQQPGTAIAKLKLVLKGVGTATYGGTIFPLTGNLTANFEIVGTTMSGPTRGRLCARGLGCASGRGFQSFDLPAGASNNWMLVADLQNPSGNSLQGTGSVDLTNGRSVPLNFLGQYNPRTDTFRLRTARGSAGKLGIQASAAGTTMLIQKLRGKIMGQVLK